MDHTTRAQLLALLDTEQLEDGAGLEIAPERYAEIAAGASLTGAEARIVLGSPLAREMLRLAPAILGLPGTVRPGDAPTARVELRPRLLAAAGRADPAIPFELDLRHADGAAWGTLRAERGFGGALAWLLTLRLDPGAWEGNVVEGWDIALVEPGTRGRMWLSGVSDGAGEIRGTWPEAWGAPRARWEGLAATPDGSFLRLRLR